MYNILCIKNVKYVHKKNVLEIRNNIQRYLFTKNNFVDQQIKVTVIRFWITIILLTQLKYRRIRFVS